MLVANLSDRVELMCAREEASLDDLVAKRGCTDCLIVAQVGVAEP